MTALLSNRRLPARGWDDAQIEYLLTEISLMDSNNFSENVGVGEREGRVSEWNPHAVVDRTWTLQIVVRLLSPAFPGFKKNGLCRTFVEGYCCSIAYTSKYAILHAAFYTIRTSLSVRRRKPKCRVPTLYPRFLLILTLGRKRTLPQPTAASIANRKIERRLLA